MPATSGDRGSDGNGRIVQGIHEMGAQGGGNGQAQCCAYVEGIMVH